MRRTLVILGGLAGVVAVAQPPADPPRPLPPAVTTGVVPASAPGAVAVTPAESPLARLEPLAALPPHSQQAVRSVLLGAGWLARMNQTHGRFLHGYRPALRHPVEADDDLKQAHAALALARAARFTGDERLAAVAGQAALTLLTATRTDPADPTCRVPVAPSVACNRVGFAALVALALYELPGGDPKRIAEADKLCEFLRKQLRPGGSVHYTDNPAEAATQADPAGVNEYPGLALQALAASHRARPDKWKADAVKAGMAHYRAWFKAKPHPTLAATLTPAFADWYLATRTNDAAAAVFEMNDWLAGWQYTAADAARRPHWAGGFRGFADGKPTDTTPTAEGGLYVQSLGWACLLTRQVPDLGRYERYKQAQLDGVKFLAGLQYTEESTRHFENTFRAGVLIGGFHLSPADGDLRIDAAAHAVAAQVRFLQSGAERN